MRDIRCNGCGRAPSQIQEYIDAGRENGMTPEEFVERVDGTFNQMNGHFLCTEDFIALEDRLGSRLGDGGTWIAP